MHACRDSVPISFRDDATLLAIKAEGPSTQRQALERQDVDSNGYERLNPVGQQLVSGRDSVLISC